MLHHIIAPLVVGAIAGGMTGDRKRRRPMLRSIVKCGIAAKRKIEAAGAAVAAETRKLVDEARAELDQAGTELHN
jgi:hypothetical protein